MQCVRILDYPLLHWATAESGRRKGSAREGEKAVSAPQKQQSPHVYVGLCLIELSEQFSMAAKVHKSHQASSGYIVNQKKISSDVALPETSPVAF